MSNDSTCPTPPCLPKALEDLFAAKELPALPYRKRWDAVYINHDVKSTVFNAIAMQPKWRQMRALSGGRSDIIVVHGPPGCGKTMLAQGACALYAELGHRRDGKGTLLLEAQASQWFSKFLGDSARIVAEAFQSVRALLTRRRIAMIINEVDSVATHRGLLSTGDPTDVHRFVNSLLNALDDLDGESQFLMLATSNTPQMLDPAFRDRVVHEFHIGYCSGAAARAILRDAARACRRLGLDVNDDLVDVIVKDLYGTPEQDPKLSGRDLADLFRMTMERFATFSPQPQQVIAVVHQLSRRNNNGNS